MYSSIIASLPSATSAWFDQELIEAKFSSILLFSYYLLVDKILLTSFAPLAFFVKVRAVLTILCAVSLYSIFSSDKHWSKILILDFIVSSLSYFDNQLEIPFWKFSFPYSLGSDKNLFTRVICP